MASRQAVPAVEIRIPRRIPVGNKIGTQTRFIPCQGTAYNLLHPAVVEVNAWSESGHAATLPRHTPAGQEGIPAACENPSPTYFKQKRRIHPLSIKSSYPVRLMKNKSAKSHTSPIVPEAPCWPSPLFPPDRPPRESMPERSCALPPETEYSSGTTPRDFPSGATARADAPFTPILPEESPSSSSAAFTAGASSRHGIPARTTAATPGPWTCAASTFRRRPAGMQDRFLLRGPATVPAAPGPAPSYIRPVSTGSGNVSP